MEMEALRLQNEELKAEVGRLKATRSAIYKLYLESEGLKIPACFSHGAKCSRHSNFLQTERSGRRESMPRRSQQSIGKPIGTTKPSSVCFTLTGDQRPKQNMVEFKLCIEP